MAEKTETLRSLQGLRISLEQQLKELTTAKVRVWHAHLSADPPQPPLSKKSL